MPPRIGAKVSMDPALKRVGAGSPLFLTVWQEAQLTPEATEEAPLWI